jgi:ADP-heptose:LPS heptosyltransferase
MSYSEQSKKLLNLQSIKIKDYFPSIEINTNRLEKNNSDLLIKGKKIAFGVDSFEDFKMWYEENFIELADLFYKKKLFDYIYLVCGPEKSYIAQKIINNSNQDYFIDCSKKDLQGIILAIKNSSFYVGNNSGPLNLSAALGVKTFGLIANDPISELKNSKINAITPKDYIDNVWNRDREGMKKLKTNDVFNFIANDLKI